MLARIALLEQVLELGLYAVVGTWLAGRYGFGIGGIVLFMAAGVLAARLVLVGTAFAVAWLHRSPRADRHHLGAAATAAMVLREWRAVLALNLVLLPWERYVLRPDPPAAPGTRPAIVMVHGYLANRGCFRTLVGNLEAGGAGPIFTPNLRSWLAPIERFEAELAAAIETIAAATGGKVILVAHSMGGLGCRAYLARHGTGRVERVITIASPHHGSALASFGLGENARQMRRHSGFLRALAHTEGGHGPGVPFLSVYSTHDNLVAPQETSVLPWARNVALGGVGHVDVLGSPALAALILEDLQAAARGA
ncbi:MAG TPA: alpha/beta fold hydrolase [Usitatibacter sp.]|nr:alpha/beta fold hydrolase [Usitatibacter sp.]